MMLTLLQLPSVYHNPPCDGCARDTEENRMRKKRSHKVRLSVIYTFRYDIEIKCKPSSVTSRTK